jgi:hypothetical protein
VGTLDPADAYLHEASTKTKSHSTTIMKLGVTTMTKLLSRNKYMFSLFVLAVLALSSGAGIKWS